MRFRMSRRVVMRFGCVLITRWRSILVCCGSGLIMRRLVCLTLKI